MNLEVRAAELKFTATPDANKFRQGKSFVGMKATTGGGTQVTSKDSCQTITLSKRDLFKQKL